MIVIVVVGAIVVAAGILLGVRRRAVARPEPEPNFIVLESNSPAISESGSLRESIGIGIHEGGFAKLLERGSEQPAETSFTFSTSEDNQDQITLRFYRGNSPEVANNTFLGEGRITGYPIAPAEEPLVRVFVRAAEGNLSLAALDDLSGKPVQLTKTKDARARTLH